MPLFDDSFEERTEDASQHRRDEWKKEGRVFQSREIVGSLLLLTATGALWFGGQYMGKGFWSVFEASFMEIERLSRAEWSIGTVMTMAQFVLKSLGLLLFPIGIAAVLVSVGSTIAQTGFVWTSKPLELNPEKLDPMQGLSRIFSMDGIVEMLKATIKFVVISAVAFIFLKKKVLDAGGLWSSDTRSLTYYLGSNLVAVLFSMGLSMLALAAADYAYQRFRYEQKIRMTKQEVREERKQLEGNPQIKARIRALQRKVAQNKMLEDVKKADVVITNPTHIAVALIYDRENMFAPRVVAKGADYMAETIKKIAREAGVPCVENVPLARALYKALKIGQFISRDLYNAVAEVLAYVYRLKGRTQL
jgi:flagellar biosynthetic protein FlhB